MIGQIRLEQCVCSSAASVEQFWQAGPSPKSDPFVSCTTWDMYNIILYRIWAIRPSYGFVQIWVYHAVYPNIAIFQDNDDKSLDFGVP